MERHQPLDQKTRSLQDQGNQIQNLVAPHDYGKSDGPSNTHFVLVDDWYQAYSHRLRPRLPGAHCRFSESEMLTLLLAMDYFPYPGEHQFLGFI